jgi:pyruvate-ferredoxin/flavodoxin oxidoreductase
VTHPPRDLTPLPDLLHGAARAGPVRTRPFLLDSPRPRIALSDYPGRELRYRILAQADPAEAERLSGLAQQEVNRRWATYEEMATHEAERFPPSAHRSNA